MGPVTLMNEVFARQEKEVPNDPKFLLPYRTTLESMIANFSTVDRDPNRREEIAKSCKRKKTLPVRRMRIRCETTLGDGKVVEKTFWSCICYVLFPKPKKRGPQFQHAFPEQSIDGKYTWVQHCKSNEWLAASIIQETWRSYKEKKTESDSSGAQVTTTYHLESWHQYPEEDGIGTPS